MKESKERISFRIKMMILFVILLASIPLCALWGAADLSYMEVSKFLISKLIPSISYEGVPYMNSIVWQLRIPRILLGLAVGGGLSICGVLMQALTKNMLAEPYILGVSSGASAMVVFMLALAPNSNLMTTLGIPGSAFIGSFVALFLVYTLSVTNGQSSSNRLLLSGVAVSIILSSLTQFFLMTLPNSNVKNILFWMSGSLASGRWDTILIPIITSLVGVICAIIMAPILNILSLGDETAATLGIHVPRMRKILLILVSLVTGTLVSASGSIGFVGLIIPHIARMLFGADHRKVAISSYLIGGLFLVWMDVGARVLFAPVDVSIGILTAFCGGPFFIWLMHRKKVR